MKDLYKIALVAVAIITAFGAKSQCTPNTTATVGVFLDAVTATNSGISVAYNPNADLYYTVDGGNSSSMSVLTFDNTGTEINAANPVTYDFRGAWWNSNTNQLECNAHSSTGIRVNDLDANSYGLTTGSIILPSGQPDVQSQGDYDWDDNEIIYYFNGSIYRYDRATGNAIGNYAITGLPVVVTNLSEHTVGYTGCPGQEIAVVDRVDGAVYLIDKSTGAYVTTVDLPASAALSGLWYDYSFTNDQLFIKNGLDWQGYYIFEQCASLSTTVSNDTVCEGEEVILHAESTGSGTISWSGGITDSVAFTPAVGTNTYTATSTDNNDCEFVIDIVVHENPTVDAGMDANLCQGDSIIMAGTGTANVWNWTGGITDGDTIVPPLGTTTYVLTGTIDTTGCQATDTVDVTYTVIDNNVTVSGIDLMADQSGATYQWIDCADTSNISGETNQGFTPTTNGNYAVIIEMGGCTDTSDCYPITEVGIEENELAGVNVFPNPSNGSFAINLEQSLEGDITIVGIDGKLIHTEKIASRKFIEINLNDVEAGVYMLQLNTESKRKTIRIIIK